MVNDLRCHHCKLGNGMGLDNPPPPALMVREVVSAMAVVLLVPAWLAGVTGAVDLLI